MKKLIFTLILLTIIGSSCKKINQISEESKEEYTVSGIIYDIDGETPLKNKHIELIRIYVPEITKNPESVLGQTVTDENGKFSMTYYQIPESDNYGLQIFAETIEGLYSSKNIISCIPPNENIEVFGSIEPQFKYNLIIKNQQEFKNDTLFFSYSYQKSSGERGSGKFSGISNTKNPNANYIILGYDSAYDLRVESVSNCVSEQFPKGVNPPPTFLYQSELFLVYGVGANNFSKLINSPVEDLFSKEPFEHKLFPEISEIVIDLKN